MEAEDKYKNELRKTFICAKSNSFSNFNCNYGYTFWTIIQNIKFVDKGIK
jgi:hypothetical protein